MSTDRVTINGGEIKTSLAALTGLTMKGRREKTYREYQEGYIRERRRVWRLRKQIKQRARGHAGMTKWAYKLSDENLRLRKEVRRLKDSGTFWQDIKNLWGDLHG